MKGLERCVGAVSSERTASGRLGGERKEGRVRQARVWQEVWPLRAALP